MKHNNLLCYENYEVFQDKNSEKKYKELKLFSSNPHVNFIKKIFDNKRIEILELGSGNSKTLFNLSINNLLINAYGVEISKSRYEFAEQWKEELNATDVININDDFLNLSKYSFPKFDLVFCVDIAFQFCEPIKFNSEIKLLKEIFYLLKESGKLILELDGLGRILKSIESNTKLWEEFDNDDPWQYSLWDCSYNNQSNILVWEKIFIHRLEHFRDRKKVELKIYNKETIQKLLEDVGFKKINFFSNWDFSELKDDSDNFIVVCEK